MKIVIGLSQFQMHFKEIGPPKEKEKFLLRFNSLSFNLSTLTKDPLGSEFTANSTGENAFLFFSLPVRNPSGLRKHQKLYYAKKRRESGMKLHSQGISPTRKSKVCSRECQRNVDRFTLGNEFILRKRGISLNDIRSF